MVIGIGGVSRSGKSTLARQMARQFEAAGAAVLVLDQDDYTLPEAALPRVKGRADWDQPASMDFVRLRERIVSAGSCYDVILVEGILVFYDGVLNGLFDKRIFIDMDKRLFMERRRAETRWGKEPEWYLEHVWKAHLRYGRSILGQGTYPVEIREAI